MHCGSQMPSPQNWFGWHVVLLQSCGHVVAVSPHCAWQTPLPHRHT
jgi:hypothetical protein